MVTEIAVLFVLVLVNGLFAGAEIATVTVRSTRVEQLLAEGSGSARAIAELRAVPERFLATVQIGITVVSAAAAAYGGDTLSDRLAPVIAPFTGQYADQIAFVAVVAGISYLSLVLGELVPKSLALRSAESYALFVARPLLGLSQLARPLVWLLTTSSNAVLSLFGDRTSFTESRVSPDELKSMLEEAGEQGALHPRVGEIAARAMDLEGLRADEIMVPRSQMFTIRANATIEDLRRLVGDAAHSKYPVYEGSVDHITGYVTVRDTFSDRSGLTTITSLIRPILFVPESSRAVDALHTLQLRGEELAIVVDEYGGTAGMLTREDLAEELFGNITRLGSNGPAEERPAGEAPPIIDGATTIRDFNRNFGLELDEDAEWSTIAGLCVGVAGRIPHKGDLIAIPGGPTFEVVEATPRRVRSVRMVVE